MAGGRGDDIHAFNGTKLVAREDGGRWEPTCRVRLKVHHEGGRVNWGEAAAWHE